MFISISRSLGKKLTATTTVRWPHAIRNPIMDFRYIAAVSALEGMPRRRCRAGTNPVLAHGLLQGVAATRRRERRTGIAPRIWTSSPSARSSRSTGWVSAQRHLHHHGYGPRGAGPARRHLLWAATRRSPGQSATSPSTCCGRLEPQGDGSDAALRLFHQRAALRAETPTLLRPTYRDQLGRSITPNSATPTPVGVESLTALILTAAGSL